MSQNKFGSRAYCHIYGKIKLSCCFAYLNDLNRDVQETYDLLIRQYAKIENVTEELKASDNFEWVRRMNSIQQSCQHFIFCNLQRMKCVFLPIFYLL